MDQNNRRRHMSGKEIKKFICQERKIIKEPHTWDCKSIAKNMRTKDDLVVIAAVEGVIPSQCKKYGYIGNYTDMAK